MVKLTKIPDINYIINSPCEPVISILVPKKNSTLANYILEDIREQNVKQITINSSIYDGLYTKRNFFEKHQPHFSDTSVRG